MRHGFSQIGRNLKIPGTFWAAFSGRKLFDKGSVSPGEGLLR